MSSEPLASLPTWIVTSAANRTHRLVQTSLHAAGFSGYEYRCLAALADRAALTHAQLAGAAALDPADVTPTVRRLHDRGLVEKRQDPAHGRRILVSLTSTGQDAARELGRVMAQIQQKAFAGLSTDERDQLLRLLSRVAA